MTGIKAIDNAVAILINCGGKGGTPGPCDIVPDTVPVGKKPKKKPLKSPKAKTGGGTGTGTGGRWTVDDYVKAHAGKYSEDEVRLMFASPKEQAAYRKKHGLDSSWRPKTGA